MLRHTLLGRIPNQERLNSLCPVRNTASFTPVRLTLEHHQHSPPRHHQCQLRHLWLHDTRILHTLEHHKHDPFRSRSWHQGMRPLRNNHPERST